MCGIAGFISPRKGSLASLKKISQALKHRGPDDEGVLIEEKYGLYLTHRRLSIIDVSSAARQPLFNEDKSVAALVNGEIYNFVDLRVRLLKKGHRFLSHSDAEVVVHAYEEWGENFTKYLRGMFAIALWDEKERALLLTRDPLGIKPLYYLKTNEAFLFASELQAFLQFGQEQFSPEINLRAVELLLMFPFIPDEQTILQHVKKLPPATTLIFKDNQLTLKKYWELVYKADETIEDFDAALEAFEEKMKETVALHLQGDVKIGIFLSGGVDSALLGSLAAKASDEPLPVFTAIFHHPLDEKGFAARVAAQMQSEQIPVLIDIKEVAENLEKMVFRFDDCSSLDGGLITLYYVAQKAREQGIKVMLNGEGADEIFGGYPWFLFADFPYRFLPDFLRTSLWYSRVSKNVTAFRSHEGREIFKGLVRQLNEKDVFRQVSKFEITYQLPNHFLMKVDKGTMSHGVETRVPYLDKDIVQFAYNLPAHFKRNGRQDKFILRSLAAKYLPHEIAYRKKQGFLLPFERLLEESRDKLESYLKETNALSSQLFTKKQIDHLLDFKRKWPFLERQREILLWKLFILELWRRRFLEEIRKDNSD